MKERYPDSHASQELDPHPILPRGAGCSWRWQRIRVNCLPTDPHVPSSGHKGENGSQGSVFQVGEAGSSEGEDLRRGWKGSTRKAHQ